MKNLDFKSNFNQKRNRGTRESVSKNTLNLGDYFKKMIGVMVVDKSEFCQGFKDVNAWWLGDKLMK